MKIVIVSVVLSFFWFLCPTFANEPAARADANVLPTELTIKTEIEYFPREVVTGPKAWAVACCALLVEYNRGWHDTLAFGPRNTAFINSTKDMLKRDWSIEKYTDIIKKLEWIEQEGHRTYFEELGHKVENLNFYDFVMLLRETTNQERLNELRIAHKYYPVVGKKSLIGWDFARAIFLCRAAYECGYMSEEEAWFHIMPYAKYLQQTFDSWEDLGRNYIIGREFWFWEQTLASGGDLNDVFLILTEMPSSPWNTLPWKMNLKTDNKNITTLTDTFTPDSNTAR
jgi:hypothetical protein